MSKECCSETASPSSGKSCCQTNTLALVYGSLLLRLWLGVRAVQTGVEKYAGSKALDQLVNVDGKPNEYGLTAGGSIKQYALENYHGVPTALMKKFEAEPLMHCKLSLFRWNIDLTSWMLPLYDKILGPALIILGLSILLGLAYRSSLFLLGLLYISLTWGLILIKQDDGVSWLGIHMVLVVMALALAGHNRLAILKKW